MDKKIVTGITPSKALNWLYRHSEEPVYPPAVAEVDGDFYQLNYFEHYSTQFYTADAENLADALNISVKLHGISTLNTVELAYIAAVCERLNIPVKEIEAFEHHGIKGDKNIETLKKIIRFCPVLQRYLSVKSIPLKTIAVFDKLETDFRRFVKNTVQDRDLSVQEFRKMVNLLFDMQGAADSEDFGPDMLEKLSEKKDLARLSFMKEFQNLTNGLPVKVDSESNFETPELTFSIRASSAEQFRQKIEKCMEDYKKIENIYRFLDEQNIC